MARRTYQGSHDVGLPVDYIMEVYGGYLDEILKRCSTFAAAEIRKNAKKFEKSGTTANMKTKWCNNTGNLRKSIKGKKSKFNQMQYVAGVADPVAHLLEYGHAKWLWGKDTGEHVPASPFIRPAEETLKAQMVSIAQQVVENKKIIIGG